MTVARILPVNCIWREVDVWDGDGIVQRVLAMVPAPRYRKLAEKQYHAGEEYPLVPLEARSLASHNQYFAALNDGFENLPDDPKALKEIGARLGIKTIPPAGFFNSEHFRKWALCETKHCRVAEIDFDSKQDAIRLAKFYRERDEYAQIIVRGTHVTVKEAFSQSAAAMSKVPFEKSKHDVLDLLEAMIGVKKGTLNREGGKAA